MNSIQKKKLLIAFLLAGSNIVFAQIDLSKFEIGLNVSSFIYQGDLTPSRLGSFETMRPGIGISVNRFLNNSFSIRANLSCGSLHGDDAVYSTPAWRKQRNFNFSTPLFETSVEAVWNILGKNGSNNNRGFSPYVFAGAGYSFLNIKRDWSRLNTAYFAGETGTFAGLATDEAHVLPHAIPVIPLGVGMRYAINQHFSVSAEWTYRMTFTDYLDGFSHAADPSKNDHYHSFSTGIIYTFRKKNYLDCPVIKN
ncbi:MAG TPA: DUF6089 family protein [Puia sp.]|nr:DUF6089 family protein [Puia sp.]